MSTPLRPVLILPIHCGQKRVGFVAAFASEEWKEQGGGPGMYRVMTGPRSWNAKGSGWWCRPGEKVSLLDLAAVLGLHGRMVRQAMGEPEAPADWPPAIRRGDRLRVTRRGPGLPVVRGAQPDAPRPAAGELPHVHTVQSFAASDPFRNEAGEWGVMAVGLGAVLCRDCEVVR